MSKEIGIYIHIPFCASKCFYCDFCSICINDKEDIVQKYIDALIKEILSSAELISERKIATIYFGGGTPSYIDIKYIKQVMDVINIFCVSDSNIECTIELNPADSTQEKLQEYVNMGFNRFSIGFQSAHNDVLNRIGRRHSKEDFEKAIHAMEAANIKNVSADIITGLPGDDENSFKNTLHYLLNISDAIKHISVYSLEVHEGTKLDFLLTENIISLPDEESERNMKYLTDSMLEKNGFEMYEISNYARPGFESKHNLNYWNCGEYLGFGTSAASHINNARYTNTSDVKKYIEKISNNTPVISEKEELDKLANMKEYVLLGLRLKKGIDVSKFKQKFGGSIFTFFKSEIDKHVSNGLLCFSKDPGGNISNVLLTAKGRDLANIVWQSFV